MRIDTHRHLGGSIGIDFVWKTIQQFGMKEIADTKQDVVERMTFQSGEPHEFHRFLSKFKILDEIRWTPELIEDSIKHICDNLISDRIDYCWMDFSINKYVERLRWSNREIVLFIKSCFESYAPGIVGLMLSLKYESERGAQKQYARLIEEDGLPEALIGIDLVGAEEYFDPYFYADLFREWNRAGKITRAHVGETRSSQNVLHAIDMIGVNEIAHGININDDHELMARCRDMSIGFHLAITGNRVTGVWPHRGVHPVRPMYDAGLDIMVGTDDPVQFSINGTQLSLDDEYDSLASMGFNRAEIDVVVKNAEMRCNKYGLLGKVL